MSDSPPAPRLAHRLLGGVLTTLLALAALVTGDVMGIDSPGWAVVAVASGLLLLVATWRNWPLLWNPLGRLLRTLLGERAARVALGFTAIAFVFAATMGAIAAQQRVISNEPTVTPHR